MLLPIYHPPSLPTYLFTYLLLSTYHHKNLPTFLLLPTYHHTTLLTYLLFPTYNHKTLPTYLLLLTYHSTTLLTYLLLPTYHLTSLPTYLSTYLIFKQNHSNQMTPLTNDSQIFPKKTEISNLNKIKFGTEKVAQSCNE